MSSIMKSFNVYSTSVVTAAVFGSLGILWLYRKIRAKQKMQELQGKVVLITGASSGIGEACAHAFYRAGSKVILCARRMNELSRVKEELLRSKVSVPTHEPHVLQMDLADLTSLNAKASEALALNGKIDILINNGGIGCRGPVVDTVMEVYQKCMQVNFFGSVALTKALLPAMTASKSGQIVFISSIQGKLAIPFRSAYAASKFAVQAFADSLRAEVAADGVHVCVVSPSYVKTTFSINALDGDSSLHGVMDSTIAKGMSPDYLANRIVQALLFKEADISVGPIVHTSAAFLRQLLPRVVMMVMRQRARQGMVDEN